MWLPLTAIAGSVLIVVAATTTTETATAIASATATGWPTFYLHTYRRVDGPPDERAQTDGQAARLRICLCTDGGVISISIALNHWHRSPVDHHIAFTLRNHVNCVDLYLISQHCQWKAKNAART